VNEAVGREQLTCLSLLRSSVTAGARTHDPWSGSPTPYRLATASPLLEERRACWNVGDTREEVGDVVRRLTNQGFVYEDTQ